MNNSRQAIHRLLNEYCYSVDRGDLDGFARLFADGSFEIIGDPGGPLQGFDAVRAMLDNLALYDGKTLTKHVMTNVLIDIECNAKLIDLGLCRLVAQETDELEGTTVGTVGYISPEQAKGAGDLDVRSDIYSLGVSLYHMVVGEVPFSGDDDFEVMSKQIMQSLRSDRIKSLNISPHVHYAIEKMMAKDRDIRFQLPDDIVTDIDAYLASIDFKPIQTAHVAEEKPLLKSKAPSSKKKIEFKKKSKKKAAKKKRPPGKKPKPPISRRRRRY